MYRKEAPGQLKIEIFYLSFGGKLCKENRWITLSGLIPWDEIESGYAEQFSKGMGAPAKPFRMALGALIIKEKLGLSDEETVEQIRENPYLQYFLGLSSYQEEAAFEASMLVHFRKRLGLEWVNRVNERVVSDSLVSEGVAQGEAADSVWGEDYDELRPGICSRGAVELG